MEVAIQNQMMYLAAWEMLKRLVSEKNIDLELVEKLNRKNAETLMCDCLPIG